jgi:uncharacterized protein
MIEPASWIRPRSHASGAAERGLGAGLLLTTEVMIAEAPKDEEHAHGAPGGMGGMGGMDMYGLVRRCGAHATVALAAAALAMIAAVFAGALPSPARAGDEHHTIWAVKGQTNTVYLFGSVHALKSADRELPAESQRAYAAAKSLVMELDLSDMSQQAGLAGELDNETLPEGQTLAGVLGPQGWATLLAHLQTLGMDPALFTQMQPWLVALTLEQLELAHLGFDPDSGVEAQFTRRAQADHKPIIALETMEEQLGIFSHMSLDQQARFLMYTLEDVDDSAQQMDEVIRAWQHGDTAVLERLLGEESGKFPDLYRLLTTERNRRWLPRLEEILHGKQDCLVIVGALHLVGKDGVVALLERDGYKVVQQ